MTGCDPEHAQSNRMGNTAVVCLTLWRRLALVAGDIKLSHSVFALPFALLATFLAAAEMRRLPDVANLTLIIVCMVLGRTVAMAMNRVADAHLDAQNPRTASRVIPSGRVSPSFMLAVAIFCAGGLVVGAAGFWLLNNNPWPVILSPLVLAWLIGYSFTKRFTCLCHLFLGGALALSPLGAAIAINPAYLGRIEPFLLALVVMCWVAGFDVIYALQDVRVDRATRICSVPAALGVRVALGIGAVLHLGAIGALGFLVMIGPTLHWSFAIATGTAAFLLVVQHAVVWATGTRHIRLMFLMLNGATSLVLGGLGILDVVLSVAL